MNHIPFELVEKILDDLSDNRPAVHNFAQTNSHILTICQKRLFSELHLTNPKRCAQLVEFHSSSPHLVSYTRSLVLYTPKILESVPNDDIPSGSVPWLAAYPNLETCLSLFQYLKSLSVKRQAVVDFIFSSDVDNTPRKLNQRTPVIRALIDLFQRNPTITSVYLETTIPLPLLNYCTNLTNLTLLGYTTAREVLEDTDTPNPQFQNLKSVTMSFCEPRIICSWLISGSCGESMRRQVTILSLSDVADSPNTKSDGASSPSTQLMSYFSSVTTLAISQSRYHPQAANHSFVDLSNLPLVHTLLIDVLYRHSVVFLPGLSPYPYLVDLFGSMSNSNRIERITITFSVDVSGQEKVPLHPWTAISQAMLRSCAHLKWVKIAVVTLRSDSIDTLELKRLTGILLEAGVIVDVSSTLVYD